MLKSAYTALPSFKRKRKGSAPELSLIDHPDSSAMMMSPSSSYSLQSSRSAPASASTSKAFKLLGVPELSYPVPSPSDESSSLKSSAASTHSKRASWLSKTPPRSSSRNAQRMLDEPFSHMSTLEVPTGKQHQQRRLSRSSDSQAMGIMTGRPTSIVMNKPPPEDGGRDSASLRTMKASGSPYRDSVARSVSMSEESYGIPSHYYPFLPPPGRMPPLPPIPVEHQQLRTPAGSMAFPVSYMSPSDDRSHLPHPPTARRIDDSLNRSNTLASQASNNTRARQRNMALESLEGRNGSLTTMTTMTTMTTTTTTTRPPPFAHPIDYPLPPLPKTPDVRSKVPLQPKPKQKAEKVERDKDASFLDWDSSDGEDEDDDEEEEDRSDDLQYASMSRWSYTPEKEKDMRHSFLTDGSRFSDLLDTEAFPRPPS